MNHMDTPSFKKYRFNGVFSREYIARTKDGV